MIKGTIEVYGRKYKVIGWPCPFNDDIIILHEINGLHVFYYNKKEKKLTICTDYWPKYRIKEIGDCWEPKVFKIQLEGDVSEEYKQEGQAL